jgi:hypothetical protein
MGSCSMRKTRTRMKGSLSELRGLFGDGHFGGYAEGYTEEGEKGSCGE